MGLRDPRYLRPEKIGGQEGTRTLTLLEHDPKSCAAANYATCPHKLFSLRMAIWTQKL